jgi:hypothetical protein
MIYSSVCLLRFIVWSFLKARLWINSMGQRHGKTSEPAPDLNAIERQNRLFSRCPKVKTSRAAPFIKVCRAVFNGN